MLILFRVLSTVGASPPPPPPPLRFAGSLSLSRSQNVSVFLFHTGGGTHPPVPTPYSCIVKGGSPLSHLQISNPRQNPDIVMFFFFIFSYKILSQMMIGWKNSPRHAAAMPYFIWGLYALIPGKVCWCVVPNRLLINPELMPNLPLTIWHIL